MIIAVDFFDKGLYTHSEDLRIRSLKKLRKFIQAQGENTIVTIDLERWNNCWGTEDEPDIYDGLIRVYKNMEEL